MKTVHIMKHRKQRHCKMTTNWYKRIVRKYKNAKLHIDCRFCGGQRQLGWNDILCYHDDSANCGCYCTCGK